MTENQLDMFAEYMPKRAPCPVAFWVFSQGGFAVRMIAMTGVKAIKKARAECDGQGRFIDAVAEDELTMMNQEMMQLAKLVNITPEGTDQQQAIQVAAAAIKRIECLKHDNWKLRRKLEDARLEYLTLTESKTTELIRVIEAAIKSGFLKKKHLEFITND
jgi:hypothetical protein